ncbi:histone-lysine N-methyltransferase 2D isoform X1 [Procambarus clarkii]|uniref:histone-lysine N-methyltransferase 2D isoform X1 n=2 Tax=Procambarus clarkii TaxID=6728 RepID=UPI001E678EF3|nr:protein TFG-like isoform X1 [Procambarus clarkii]
MSDKREVNESQSASIVYDVYERNQNKGPPPASPYGATAPNVSYAPMIASGAPPSYVESLSHQVVAGPGVPHQFSSPYATQASAAAVSAAQLQNYKDYYLKLQLRSMQQSHGVQADNTSSLLQYEDVYPLLLSESLQSMAAAQQAQKLAYSQQAYQQQQTALYMQQQQQLYLQQLQGYYQPHAPPPGAGAGQVPGLQPGQNVLIMNGYDSGARFDGIAQPSIPPPPPGIAPNAAQLAAASGTQVSMSQKKGSFLNGGAGGGYTFF